jgi:hypothetical protein
VVSETSSRKSVAGNEKLVTSAEDMLRDEFHHVVPGPRWLDRQKPLPELIAELQHNDQDKRPSALCLSGGGIRSATFSLGVLQWLASQGRLGQFHYLSSVSGGGYAAGFVVNGLRNAYREAVDEATQAGSTQREADLRGQEAANKWIGRLGNSAGTDHAASAAGAARITDGGSDPIAPLRAYSNYLSPTGGLSSDTFALVAIFLRNLFLNLLVWLPLLAVLVAMPRIYIALLIEKPQIASDRSLMASMAMFVVILVVVSVAYMVADLPSRPGDVGKRHSRKSDTPVNRFSLYCFAPITLAAVLVSILGAWSSEFRNADWWMFAIAGAVAHLVGIVFGWQWRHRLRELEPRAAGWGGFVVVVLVGLAGGALVSLIVSRFGPANNAATTSALDWLLYGTLAVPAMTGAFCLAMALQAGLLARTTYECDREWWARATAAWLRFTLFWLLAFGLVVWFPIVLLERAADAGITAAKFGIGGGALGVMTALVGYWSKSGAQVTAKAKGILRATGANLLSVMAGLVLAASVLALTLTWSVLLENCGSWSWTHAVCKVDISLQADYLRDQAVVRAGATSIAKSGSVQVLPMDSDPTPAKMSDLGNSAGPQIYAAVLLGGGLWSLVLFCGSLMIVAIGLSQCMGVNHFSLHGMYGNRLIRAFLGAGRPTRRRRPHWFTGFDPADDPPLNDMQAPLRGSDGSPRLYPVVNMALNLVKPSEKRLDWQQRKAASFFASPRHCGAAHLGFRPTDQYAGGMSLGRAMTISGAAASPNMGYHSAGLVTLVMTLFNVRLGWWAPNPEVNKYWYRGNPLFGLKVLLAEARGATGDEDPFAYLSDGGHFENTGLYEMVRRRCKLIVVVDATCDGDFKWNDLLDAVRKIRVDFGVPIDLDDDLSGVGRKANGRRWLRGTVRYSSRDPAIKDGQLIVIKPILISGDPPELAAYARDSAKDGSPEDDPGRFPHQSTADQFFDEQQFESYRLLGFVSARAALLLDRPPRTNVPAVDPSFTSSLSTSPPIPPLPDGGALTNALQSVGNAGQLVQQVGTSLALAAAVTVGGTLGVAGTVALQPSQIALSQEDRELLKAGIGVSIGSGLQGNLSPLDRELLQKNIDTMASFTGARLSDKDKELLAQGVSIGLDKEALRTLSSTTETVQKLLAAVKDLQNNSGFKVNLTVDSMDDRALQRVANALAMAVASQYSLTPLSLKDLASSIAKLEYEIAALKAQPPASRVLDKMYEQLTRLNVNLEKTKEDLSTRLEAGIPRRNIRGQDGGSR